MAKVIIKETDVTIISTNEKDYISLTDIARYKSDDPTWLRNRNTFEYFGNHIQSLIQSPRIREVYTRWIGKTDAIGIISKSGRYSKHTLES